MKSSKNLTRSLVLNLVKSSGEEGITSPDIARILQLPIEHARCVVAHHLTALSRMGVVQRCSVIRNNARVFLYKAMPSQTEIILRIIAETPGIETLDIGRRLKDVKPEARRHAHTYALRDLHEAGRVRRERVAGPGGTFRYGYWVVGAKCQDELLGLHSDATSSPSEASVATLGVLSKERDVLSLTVKLGLAIAHGKCTSFPHLRNVVVWRGPVDDPTYIAHESYRYQDDDRAGLEATCRAVERVAEEIKMREGVLSS